MNAVKPGPAAESFGSNWQPEQYKDIYNQYNGSEGVDVIVDQSRLLNKIFNVLTPVRTRAGRRGVMAIARCCWWPTPSRCRVQQRVRSRS